MSTPEPSSEAGHIPPVQRYAAVLWPSFVLAGAATGVFFTFLDPHALFDCTGEPPLSRTAAYSLGFFGFWLLAAASAGACAWFLRPRVRPGSTHAASPPA